MELFRCKHTARELLRRAEFRSLAPCAARARVGAFVIYWVQLSVAGCGRRLIELLPFWPEEREMQLDFTARVASASVDVMVFGIFLLYREQMFYCAQAHKSFDCVCRRNMRADVFSSRSFIALWLVRIMMFLYIYRAKRASSNLYWLYIALLSVSDPLVFLYILELGTQRNNSWL